MILIIGLEEEIEQYRNKGIGHCVAIPQPGDGIFAYSEFDNFIQGLRAFPEKYIASNNILKKYLRHNIGTVYHDHCSYRALEKLEDLKLLGLNIDTIAFIGEGQKPTIELQKAIKNHKCGIVVESAYDKKFTSNLLGRGFNPDSEEYLIEKQKYWDNLDQFEVPFEKMNTDPLNYGTRPQRKEHATPQRMKQRNKNKALNRKKRRKNRRKQ